MHVTSYPKNKDKNDIQAETLVIELLRLLVHPKSLIRENLCRPIVQFISNARSPLGKDAPHGGAFCWAGNVTLNSAFRRIREPLSTLSTFMSQKATGAMRPVAHLSCFDLTSAVVCNACSRYPCTTLSQTHLSG